MEGRKIWFVWTATPPGADYYLLEEFLTGEETAVQGRIRAFSNRGHSGHQRVLGQGAILARPRLSEPGLADGNMEGQGYPGIRGVASGLVALETMACGDSTPMPSSAAR